MRASTSAGRLFATAARENAKRHTAKTLLPAIPTGAKITPRLALKTKSPLVKTKKPLVKTKSRTLKTKKPLVKTKSRTRKPLCPLGFREGYFVATKSLLLKTKAHTVLSGVGFVAPRGQCRSLSTLFVPRVSIRVALAELLGGELLVVDRPPSINDVGQNEWDEDRYVGHDPQCEKA